MTYTFAEPVVTLTPKYKIDDGPVQDVPLGFEEYFHGYEPEYYEITKLNGRRSYILKGFRLSITIKWRAAPDANGVSGWENIAKMAKAAKLEFSRTGGTYIEVQPASGFEYKPVKTVRPAEIGTMVFESTELIADPDLLEGSF